MWCTRLVFSILFHSFICSLSQCTHKYSNKQNKSYVYLFTLSVWWRLYSSPMLLKLLLVRFKSALSFYYKSLYLRRCSNSMRNNNYITAKQFTRFHSNCMVFVDVFFIWQPKAFRPNYSCLICENTCDSVFECNSLIDKNVNYCCWFFWRSLS